MTAGDIENKIYYAIKFIVKREAIPDTVALNAAEAATREVVRYQKEQHQSVDKKAIPVNDRGAAQS
jgi:hypothetical protein